MEYGKRISTNTKYNPGYTKYIGWDIAMDNNNIRELWKQDTLVKCQKIIAERSRQYHPEGLATIASLDNIGSVLFQCYEANQPHVGDIYSRYIMDATELQRNDLRQIIESTINIFLNHIKTQYGMIECNNSLTIWNALRGDFNEHGLRSHSTIKLNKKRPPSQIHMRY